MTKNDGGPAFPGEYAITMGHPEGGDETRMISGGGMSLRDWFAGQALAGLVSRQSTNIKAAEGAYACADAMLAERDKEKDDPYHDLAERAHMEYEREKSDAEG